MATDPNVGEVSGALFISGRLVIDPTDLTAGPEFGGTDLGFIGDIRVDIDRTSAVIKAEELTSLTVDHITGPVAILIQCLLREFDSAKLAVIFDGAGEATSSGFSWLATQRGSLGSDRAHKLLLTSRDEQDPFLLCYSAIPDWQATAQLQYSLPAEYGLPIVWEAIPDSAGNFAQHRTVDKLTLSP